MRIACPNCSAAYDVPAERMPPGRGVRCVRCESVWTPVALVDAEPEIVPLPAPVVTAPVVEAPVAVPEPRAVPEPLAVPEPEPLPEPVQPSPPRRAPLVLAWVLTVAVLAALGWFAASRRAEIVQAWPASERAYVFLEGLRGR